MAKIFLNSSSYPSDLIESLQSDAENFCYQIIGEESKAYRGKNISMNYDYTQITIMVDYRYYCNCKCLFSVYGCREVNPPTLQTIPNPTLCPDLIKVSLFSLSFALVCHRSLFKKLRIFTVR